MDRPLLSQHAPVPRWIPPSRSLAHTVLSQNARTLDDLVKEMLRPMLKSWLDDNLPSLVERLVRAEIERVSRGRYIRIVVRRGLRVGPPLATRPSAKTRRQDRKSDRGSEENRHRAIAVDHRSRRRDARR